MKSIARLGMRHGVPGYRHGAHTDYLSTSGQFVPVRAFQPLTVLAMALILAISCPSQARAQGSSVTIGKNQLQPATCFKARTQIQIIDERPIVHDLRTPEQAPEKYVIPIPPMPTAQGAGASSGVRMEHSNLTPAGFGQSNIPAGGMAPARSLPTTKSGGLSPVDKPPRPIGLAAPAASQRQASVTGKAPTAVATYSKSYNHGLSLLSGSSGSDLSVNRDVQAKLRHP